MMKIRPYLLVSISYISLCSLAQADISAVENEFIFTHTSNTHLASQPQLLSSSNLPQTQSEHRDLSAPISLAVTDGPTASVASVCFITDAGNCSGNEFGNSPEGEPSGGSSSGGSSSSGGDVCAPNDAWCLDNQKRCELEGYTQTACNSVSTPTNFCPYDNRFFEKCTCHPDLVTCTKPYYGVGESCGGKYKSCQLDNPRACREEGYTNTCPAGQKLRKTPRCPYDNSFGICCTEHCPTYSSTSGTYGATGIEDGCGYMCNYTCQINCPSGTSESNPGGCGGSTKNGCGNKTCYYPYKACCTPSPSQSGCSCGTYSCSDGCGGYRTCCKSCPSSSSSSSSSSSGGGCSSRSCYLPSCSVTGSWGSKGGYSYTYTSCVIDCHGNKTCQSRNGVVTDSNNAKFGGCSGGSYYSISSRPC